MASGQCSALVSYYVITIYTGVNDEYLQIVLFICMHFSFQPDTVPQARLDMFTAIAVEEADEATGNPHSLAITSSDRSIHFVRGACREEAKGWKDVLTSYMRHTTQVYQTIL